MSGQAFQVGDRVRNRLTAEEGEIVRVYFDLKHPSLKASKAPVYVVGLGGDVIRPAREALWQAADMTLLSGPEG